MAFTYHLNPHHVHVETSCTNHVSSECIENHWRGGRPERDHPHHVEIDISTGLVGYTRLTNKEIKELEKRTTEYTKQQAEFQSKKDADLAQFKTRADKDPDFAALLRHLGIHNEN